MKIAVIGAGSTYSPELLSGLLQYGQEMDLSEVYLMDIDPDRLGIVGGLAQRIVARAGNPFEVKLTESQSEAVAGASFVLTQLRVGGQKARHLDTRLCLDEGLIGQETTGPAGFAKAMRTIPVMLDICQDMQVNAPDAWLINFTNPSGIITEAVLKHGGVRCIGLCNVPIGIQMRIARKYNVDYEAVDLDYVGLNHLSWVRRVWVNGNDVSADLLPYNPYGAANLPETALSREFLAALNMMPNGYLRYFYLTDEVLRDLQAQERTRAEQVMEIEAQLLAKYSEPDRTEVPQELSKRGGAHYSTVAVSLMRSIATNSGKRHIVNVQNQGVIPDLPPEAVIEVTASVDKRGAHPLPVGSLETEIRGLVQHVKAYEELTVEAAVTNDYNKAWLALANNPLVNSIHRARRLLDLFIAHHKLPLTSPNSTE